MPYDGHLIEIIHAGAAKSPVRRRKTGWLNNMGRNTETGTKPEHGARVLGDIGLVERQLHDNIFLLSTICGKML